MEAMESQRKKYHWTLISLGIALSILTASEVIAIPYDDFSEPHINIGRWKQAESVREVDVSNHRLLFELGTPNSGTIEAYPYKITNDLVFFDPQSIHAVEADVSILQNHIINNGAVKALVGGRWFHYYLSGQGGYVWGEIALSGDATGLKASWSVLKLDSYYSVLETLGAGDFTTTINIGTPNTLYIGYDENVNQFIFRVGTEEQTFGPAGLPEKDSIGFEAWKYLLTQVEAVDSASSGYVSAAFSNVYVNGLPYEEFSSVLLDPSKWWIAYSTIDNEFHAYDEFAREISGGSFRSKIRTHSSYNYGLSSCLEFLYPSSIRLISAKITPMQYQNGDNWGTRVEAYIAGHFYNEGTSKIGYAGEVEAKIWIGGNWNGGGAVPTVHWWVRNWSDSPGSFSKILDYGAFAMPIVFGYSYILSLGLNENQLTFKIVDVTTGNSEEHAYIPATSINPPNIPLKEIGTFIADSIYGLEAIIEAFFDDVTIEPAITDITVVSPNGGETWPAGSMPTIRWTYTSNVNSNVKIELLKGGVVSSTIASSVSKGSGGNGSRSWTIPANQPPGTDYRIRISTIDGAYIDTSDSDFTIASPTITVTSPNGGETWATGSTQTIRWNYFGNPGSYVKIELLKGGVVNRTIVPAAPKGSAGSGSRNWTIPANQTPGTDYRIRVTSTTNGAYTDTSDSDFTIAAPTITVISPNGGETLIPGTTQTIRWTYTGNPGSYVKIELLKGGTVNRIIKSLTPKGSGGNGSFNWIIPETQAADSDYQIRVTSTTNSSYNDTSDTNFTILEMPPPAITVLYPNGGDILGTGATEKIRWSYVGNPGPYVKVELLKGGVVNRTINSLVSKGSGGSGSCNWLVPANLTPGTDYRIRVTSTANGAYTDTSDADFTIATPSISVVSPNGGETWTAGTRQTIRWSYIGNPGSHVRIELLKGGVVPRVITTFAVEKGTGGSGSFNWLIPSAQALGDDYQIRVTSTYNNIYSDTSDTNFTIN